MADNAPHIAIIRIDANIYQKGQYGQFLPDIVYDKKITFSIETQDKSICIRRVNELLGEIKRGSDNQRSK